jgi:DNA ligase 1
LAFAQLKTVDLETGMSSPAKKRKLNNASSKTSTAPAKGLEYFFAKQKQNNSLESKSTDDETQKGIAVELTDEELARRLQEEWNRELHQDTAADSGSTHQNDISAALDMKEQTGEVSRGIEPQMRDQSIIDTPKTPEVAKTKTLTLQSAGMSEDTVTTSIPLDESPLTFDPAKYVGQLQGHWASEGGDAAYALLTRCFVLVSGTTSRIKIVDTLVNCLRVLIEGDPDSLLPAVSLSSPVP